MERRKFLTGLAGILASGMAPAIGHAGILMPVRKIITEPVCVMRTSWYTRHELMKLERSILESMPVPGRIWNRVPGWEAYYGPAVAPLVLGL